MAVPDFLSKVLILWANPQLWWGRFLSDVYQMGISNHLNPRFLINSRRNNDFNIIRAEGATQSIKSVIVENGGIIW